MKLLLSGHSIPIVVLTAAIVMAPLAYGQSVRPAIGERIGEFEAWLDLARRHAPGKVDASVTQARRIGVERHFAFAHDLRALIQFINDPGRYDLYKPSRPYSFLEKEVLRKIAARERAAGTTDGLLRMVALLESDSVMLTGGERYVVVPPGSELPRDMILSMDGVGLEAVTVPPNWQLARQAIGAMSDDRDTVAWGRLWYEATTAFLFSDLLLAPLPKHLAQRRLEFPEDAGAWFDEGCYFEYLAGDRFQQAMESGPRKGLRIVGHDRKEALAQARRMYEAAVERDPRHPEARLRLARVKLVQRDARSAVRELTAVLPDLGTDSVLRYLAYLFLGAAQESAGDVTAAMTAYREAVNLYPRAQSPRVALARIEPPSSSSDADPLEYLLRGDRPRSDDPWLAYHTGPAPRSRALSAEFWRVSTIR
jgi:tetratricopeptide (TPR) repeat protein